MDGIALTHGAGGNCESKLLVSVADRLSEAGFHVVRFDLPFRKSGRGGAPTPAHAALDREGIREAVLELRKTVTGRIIAGGHSYGGRQTSMLASEDPGVADAILLLSYPLHPPRKPDQLRTAHLPNLRTPTLFVHGSRDPFGSLEELRAAMQLISGPTKLSEIEGAGHDLRSGKFDVGAKIVQPLRELLG